MIQLTVSEMRNTALNDVVKRMDNFRGFSPVACRLFVKFMDEWSKEQYIIDQKIDDMVAKYNLVFEDNRFLKTKGIDDDDYQNDMNALFNTTVYFDYEKFCLGYDFTVSPRELNVAKKIAVFQTEGAE